MEHPKNAGTNPRNNKCAVVMMDGISLLLLLLLLLLMVVERDRECNDVYVVDV
jgi:hypothetical protein